MSTDNGKFQQITSRIRWIARIWSVPLILYALIMFFGYGWSWVTTGVADPYAVKDSPPQEALAPILMFMGVLGLGIAWRWERSGGWLDILFQIAVILVLLFTRPIAQDFPRFVPPYLLALVAAIPGILFLVSWRRSHKLPAGFNTD